MNRTTLGLAGLACAVVGAGVSMGAISTVVGMGTQIAPPAVANFPTLTGPLVDAWDEQQNVTLPAAGVLVDMFVNGGSMTSGAPTAGVVTGVVDSHFLHLTSGPLPFVSGTVTFSGAILGVIYSDLWLDLSDTYGAFGTVYPTTVPLRGMNTTGFLSAAGNTLQFQFQAQTGAIEIEQVRVLTRAVPAPGGVCLGALGMLAGMRRRR
ncbi:MAG: hypothetical protein AB7G17_12210 [Phycisphaerales bacterium]